MIFFNYKGIFLKNKFINKIKSIKFWHYFDTALIATSTILISIIPATTAAADGIYYLNLGSIVDANLLGINQKGWKELKQVSFNNSLVFSDFYLPIINQSMDYNIPHSIYPAYGDINNFYIYKMSLLKPFKNIDGKQIENYNSDTFMNDIIPYYNYVVIKSNDLFMENILNLDRNNYHLWINIQNQIFIYKNNKINFNNQQEFLKYNPITLYGYES
ncbi:hypothetical protein J6P11_00525 [bacterium]|nr:hypothetical protein [bacterium]